MALLLAGGGACGGLAPADPNDVPEVRITNNGEVSINLVNISPCSSPEWGANLVRGSIRVGESQDYQLSSGCYDLRAGRTTSSSVTTSSQRGILITSGQTYLWSVSF